MRQKPTNIRLPRSDAEAAVLIVRFAIWLAVVLGGTVGGLLLIPRSPAADMMSDVKVPMAVDTKLAEQGKKLFIITYGCTSCHAVRQAKVNGQTTGPDLSRALLGQVPLGQVNTMAQWLKENEVSDAMAKPDKAAELVHKFLMSPPPYAKTMTGQVRQFKIRAGGEKAWDASAKALVEFLKTTVAKPPALESKSKPAARSTQPKQATPSAVR